jgi:DNA polymerase-1
MTLLVVDGSNAIHRAHYAVPKMSHKGTPTNAVVGFMRIVLSNLRITEATHCGVVFDLPGRNFRHELFDEYKGTREKKPEVSEALAIQVPICADLCRAIGLRMVGKKNVEGDDIIGHLAVEYAKEYDDLAVILSNDKDFADLLKHRKVRLMNPNKGMITRKRVPEIWGVKASQMVDYLMLEGDKIDNIPGVKGVGEVTILKMLGEYRRVEDVPAEMFPKAYRDPKAFKALHRQFKLTRKLLTIRLDCVRYDLRKLERRKGDPDMVKEICAEYGLNKLQADLLRAC